MSVGRRVAGSAGWATGATGYLGGLLGSVQHSQLQLVELALLSGLRPKALGCNWTGSPFYRSLLATNFGHPLTNLYVGYWSEITKTTVP